MAGHMARNVRHAKMLQNYGPGELDTTIPVGNSNVESLLNDRNESHAFKSLMPKDESKLTPSIFSNSDVRSDLSDWSDPLDTEFLFPRGGGSRTTSHLNEVMCDDAPMKIGISSSIKPFNDSKYVYPLIVPNPVGEYYDSHLETVPRKTGSPKINPLCNYESCSLDYRSLQFDSMAEAERTGLNLSGVTIVNTGVMTIYHCPVLYEQLEQLTCYVESRIGLLNWSPAIETLITRSSFLEVKNHYGNFEKSRDNYFDRIMVGAIDILSATPTVRGPLIPGSINLDPIYAGHKHSYQTRVDRRDMWDMGSFKAYPGPGRPYPAFPDQRVTDEQLLESNLADLLAHHLYAGDLLMRRHELVSANFHNRRGLLIVLNATCSRYMLYNHFNRGGRCQIIPVRAHLQNFSFKIPYTHNKGWLYEDPYGKADALIDMCGTPTTRM